MAFKELIAMKKLLKHPEEGEMLSKEEMLQLRRSYIEIGKLVQKYGGYERYSAELKYLMSQVKCVDSDEDDKSKHQYLVQGYKCMVGHKENISEFAICNSGEGKEVERQLNRKLDEEWGKVWAIMRKYIP